MTSRERIRDRGQREARATLGRIAADLRDACLSAGPNQTRVAEAAGLKQSRISRTERAINPLPRIDELAAHCSAVGLRLSVKTYPTGSGIRDEGQLRLIERLRAEVADHFPWRSEVPVGGQGDLRAWDVVLDGSGPIGIDVETRLHDFQALWRRVELEWRDSHVSRLILLVADTRHNRAVLREHRVALLTTFPLATREVLAALRAPVRHPLRTASCCSEQRRASWHEPAGSAGPPRILWGL